MTQQLNVSLLLQAKDQNFEAEIRDARSALKGLADQAESTGNSIGDRLTRSSSEWSTKLKGTFRGIGGQVALQMQDIAVQLQGGASPLTVLSQQGTQLASLFGPHGAIIGAIGAGVVLGIGALKSLGGDGFAVAERAARDLEDALEEANRTLGEGALAADKIVKAYAGLSGTTQGLGAVKIRQDMIDTKIATEEAQRAVQGLVEEIEAASSARLVGGSGLADIGGGFGPGSILAGEITRTQAGQLQAVVAGFESGALNQVQLISEVQKVLAGASRGASVRRRADQDRRQGRDRASQPR